MNPSRVIKNFLPLYSCDDYILGFRNFAIFKYFFHLDSMEKVADIPCVSFRHKFLGYLSIFRRIFRLSPFSWFLFNDFIVFTIGSRVYSYSLAKNTISLSFLIPGRKKALNFSTLILDGVSYLCFGEYFSNPNRDSVNIWVLIDDEWTIFYTFPSQTIEHIHNLYVYRDQLLILTGDFNEASGIWALSLPSLSLKKLLTGSQNYRACWLDFSSGHITYATDSQYCHNYLFVNNCSDLFSSDFNPSLSFPINGSSIYSCTFGDLLVFSTAVEPGLPVKNRLIDLLSFKLGPSIYCYRSFIYFFSKSNHRLRVFYSLPKDFFPLKLGQFGTFLFPCGSSKKLIVYSQSLKFSGSTIIFDDV